MALAIRYREFTITRPDGVPNNSPITSQPLIASFPYEILKDSDGKWVVTAFVQSFDISFTPELYYASSFGRTVVRVDRGEVEGRRDFNFTVSALLRDDNGDNRFTVNGVVAVIADIAGKNN